MRLEQVALTEIESERDLDRSALLSLLNEPMLDRCLDYREDKPNSPGWLAIDRISG